MDDLEKLLVEMTNQDYVYRIQNKLSPTQRERVKKMRELGVDEDRVRKYIDAKISERLKRLKKSYFRTKIGSHEYTQFHDVGGIKFFVKSDDPIIGTPGFERLKRTAELSAKELMKIRDILPIKKPKIVVQELDEKAGYAGDVPPAYYKDRVIYIDQYELSDPALLVHEYAHYIVDLIPKQSEPILHRSYREMLDYYYRSTHKKKNYDLEDKPKEPEQNEVRRSQREKIAKYLGLPSEYAFQNFDEFFAEIITHWKSIPNNKATYRFKQAVKSALTRL